MELHRKKSFMVHFGGRWDRDGNKYTGGKSVVLSGLDGDELCLMDLIKDIEEMCGVKQPIVQWKWDGAIGLIENDRNIMQMWDHIELEKGFYHLYLQESKVATSLSNQTGCKVLYGKSPLTHKEPTTPTKSIASVSEQPRRSPRLADKNLSSTLSPKQPAKKCTPKKIKSELSPLGFRRSPRLLSKFQFKFTSDVPLVISDDEDAGTAGEDIRDTGLVGEGLSDAGLVGEGLSDVGAVDECLIEAGLVDEGLSNIGAVNEGLTEVEVARLDEDDWALKDLIEYDFQSNGNNRHGEKDFGFDHFDNIDAAEGYHTADDGENSEEISEDDGENSEEISEDDGDPHEPTSIESGGTNTEGTTNEFDDFVFTSDNLYEDEDKDRCGEGGRHEEDLQLHDNMEWPTMQDCRKFMRKYAIFKKFEYKQKKNDNLKIDLVCKDINCKWRVYVRKMPGEHTAKLRSLVPEHICKCDEKCKNTMAHAGWVANEIEEAIRNHKDFKPKDVIAEIWQQHGIKISYSSAYQAKIICHERIYGSYKDGYKMVPEIREQILLRNPGSVVDWLRSPQDHSFVSLCVAFKASLDGFVNGCRPILGLDGCFLKGKYGGVLLSIVSLDGNNGLFPIGIFICRSECYDSWSTFLNTLKPYLQRHPLPLTFISDRQKGLIDAVMQVFSGSPHRYCFRHMYKNFKNSGFKGSHLEHLSWGAAKAYRREDHDRWMEVLQKANVDAWEWLDHEAKTSWARSHFDTTCHCEHITNNFSESFNKMMLTLRDLPLVKLVEKYQFMVMSLLYNRNLKGLEMDGEGLVPRVVSTITKLKKTYNKYTTQGAHETLHVAINRHGVSWKVDINAKTCSCCEWQVTGIPCEHAIAVIMPMRDDWIGYCSPFFTVQAYRATYSAYVHPVEDSHYWPKPQVKILPPPLQRPPGRPRVKRRKDADEPDTQKRLQKRCSKCGQLGHNKKTCKGAPATDPSGRRVRPRTEAEGYAPSMPQAIPNMPRAGPSMATAGPSMTATGPSMIQINKPQLIIPAMPVPRTNTSMRGRYRGRGGFGERNRRALSTPDTSGTKTQDESRARWYNGGVSSTPPAAPSTPGGVTPTAASSQGTTSQP